MKKWKRTALLICAVFLAAAAGPGMIGTVYGKTQENSESQSEAPETRTGTVTIDYKDGDSPLSGAEFTFYRIVNGKKEDAGTARTDQNGSAGISLLKGTYEVRETKSVTGYAPSAVFRMSVPMDNGNGGKSYRIRIIPKPVPAENTKTTSGSVTSSKSSGSKKVSDSDKEETVLQKLLPVKTSDDGEAAVYLVILGSAVVVIGVMIRIRMSGRKS